MRKLLSGVTLAVAALTAGSAVAQDTTESARPEPFVYEETPVVPRMSLQREMIFRRAALRGRQRAARLQAARRAGHSRLRPAPAAPQIYPPDLYHFRWTQPSQTIVWIRGARR